MPLNSSPARRRQSRVLDLIGAILVIVGFGGALFLIVSRILPAVSSTADSRESVSADQGRESTLAPAVEPPLATGRRPEPEAAALQEAWSSSEPLPEQSGAGEGSGYDDESMTAASEAMDDDLSPAAEPESALVGRVEAPPPTPRVSSRQAEDGSVRPSQSHDGEAPAARALDLSANPFEPPSPESARPGADDPPTLSANPFEPRRSDSTEEAGTATPALSTNPFDETRPSAAESQQSSEGDDAEDETDSPASSEAPVLSANPFELGTGDQDREQPAESDSEEKDGSGSESGGG